MAMKSDAVVFLQTSSFIVPSYKESEISIKLFTVKGVISHKNMALVVGGKEEMTRTATGYIVFSPSGHFFSTTFEELSPINL